MDDGLRHWQWYQVHLRSFYEGYPFTCFLLLQLCLQHFKYPEFLEIIELEFLFFFHREAFSYGVFVLLLFLTINRRKSSWMLLLWKMGLRMRPMIQLSRPYGSPLLSFFLSVLQLNIFLRGCCWLLFRTMEWQSSKKWHGECCATMMAGLYSRHALVIAIWNLSTVTYIAKYIG